MAGFGIPSTGISTARPTSGINPASRISSHVARMARGRAARATFEVCATSQAEACTTAMSNQPQPAEFFNQCEIGAYGRDGLAPLLNPAGMHMTQVRGHAQILHLLRINSHDAATCGIH